MIWHRFSVRRRRKAPDAVVVPPCASVEAMPTAFSPLITQLLAVHAHTRQINRLAQQEVHCAEFRLAARAVVSQLLEAWAHQTDGRGSIDDLLVEPGSWAQLHEI